MSQLLNRIAEFIPSSVMFVMDRKTDKELGFSSELLSFPLPAFSERMFGKFPDAP